MSTSSMERFAAAPQEGLIPRDATSGAWAWAALGLVLVGGAAAVLHWQASAAAGATWISSPTYSYGLLVPPVVAFLLWRQRETLRQSVPEPWPWGLALVGAAALVATGGRVISTLVVEQLAFVAILQAAALTILGPGIFSRIAFPLLYLYLAVPIGDGLIAPLQEFTAWFAVVVLETLGVPVRLDGLLIRIPRATFHVAEACAGLRFLLASVAVGVLLAGLFLRRWWHRLAFVLISIALPIVGNGLRVAGLVLIAHMSDLRLAIGVDHLTYGYGFTALLLAGLVALAALLGTPGRLTVDRFAAPPATKAPKGRIQAMAVAAVLATTLPAFAARPAADECRSVQVIAPPKIAWPWMPSASSGAWRPAAANPDGEIWQGYRSGDRTVDLYVGFYCAQREGAEAVSQAHRMSGSQPWVVLRPGQYRAGDGATELAVQQLQVRSGAQKRLVLVWYWVDGRFTADPLVAKMLQAKAALFGGPAAAAVIAASTPYDAEPTSAHAALGQALIALEPLDRFLIRLGGSAAARTTP